MDRAGNIVIGDASAEFLLLHDDAAKRIEGKEAWASPLETCAADAEGLKAFNVEHPLYGGRPVTVLVPRKSLRHTNADIHSRLASGCFPARSFFELRQGLFAATPECAFLRAASHVPFGSLVALGVNLCARYYLKLPDCEIVRRTGYLTSCERLGVYLDDAVGMYGVKQARRALKYVSDNSGSPEETRLWVLLRLPQCYGGFGLPVTHLNYDVRSGRLSSLMEQGKFELDIVALSHHLAIEYDGQEHLDTVTEDMRRRNDLKLLGWDVYPIDSDTLYSAAKTERMGKQLAKLLGKRLRCDAEWRHKYYELRKAIGLPA